MMRNLGSGSSKLKTAGKLFVAAEVLGFLGCYMFWRKLNRDQDFRYQASVTYPPLLEAYYTVGESIDPSNKIRWATRPSLISLLLMTAVFRDHDQLVWRSRDQKTEQNMS